MSDTGWYEWHVTGKKRADGESLSSDIRRQKGRVPVSLGVGITFVALESRIDCVHVEVALCLGSGIGEGPRALRTAKSVFCGRMFPAQ